MINLFLYFYSQIIYKVKKEGYSKATFIKIIMQNQTFLSGFLADGTEFIINYILSYSSSEAGESFGAITRSFVYTQHVFVSSVTGVGIQVSDAAWISICFRGTKHNYLVQGSLPLG